MKYTILSNYKNEELAQTIMSDLTAEGNECYFNLRDAKKPLSPSFWQTAGGDVVLMMLDEETVQNKKFWSICDGLTSKKNIYKVRMIKTAEVELTEWYQPRVDVIDGTQSIEAILFQIKNPGEPLPLSISHTVNVSAQQVTSQLTNATMQTQSQGNTGSRKVETQSNDSMPTVGNEENNNEEFFKNQRCQGVSFESLLNIPDQTSMTVKRALRYFHGEGVPQDYNRATQLLKKAIEENSDDAIAHYLLGAYYETLGKDAEAAKEYYAKAVDLDYNSAIIRCATVAISKDSDNSEARNMFLKVRAEGNIEGSYGLGLLCEAEGNYEDAFEYYSEAAELGDARAQNALGCLYDEGKGVSENRQSSWQWFELAAKQGLVEAMTNMGARLITQDGEAFNVGTQYLRQAAEAGNQLAIHLVSQIDMAIAKQERIERQKVEKQRTQQETDSFISGLFNVLGEGASYAKRRLWDEI